MKAMTIDQKAAYVNEKKEQFLSSGKTSTPEYKEKFESWTIEQQFAAIRRQETYNERKNNGTTTTRPTKKSTSPIDMLLVGEKIEISNEDATNLIEKFQAAISLLETIIEDNKKAEKQALQDQIAELQARLKELK
jgi:hypothetical protein